MRDASDTTPTLAPAAPTSREEAGLSRDAVEGLVLKTLQRGEMRGTDLADHLRLPYDMLEPSLEHGRIERLIEVRGAQGLGTAGYTYGLTDLGYERATRHLAACGYVGPAPVPLAQYVAFVEQGMRARPQVTRDGMQQGFSHLVVPDAMIDQLGPAVSSGRALFLYGPPGNGKSAMGEGIGRVLGGDVFVPHAVDVDGQVIALYDPVAHEARDDEDPQALVRPDVSADRRWVRIRRPVVTVGGELTLDMLELTFNTLSSFYEAPLQVKANGGVLIVDDFGRQRVPASDLLNRWIVPLENRIDYLTLHTGRKFSVPFDVLIVFATNLEPHSLADEAFLRRIPYKVLAENPSPAQFEQIFRRNCERLGFDFSPEALDFLEREYYSGRGLERRACHPRDLLEQVANLCRYLDRDAIVSTDLLDAACRCYFLKEPLATQGVAA